MKHSNICYIQEWCAADRKSNFSEVNGMIVKNSYNYDLFRYKNKDGNYIVSEGHTGFKICEIRKDITGRNIIADVKEIDTYLSDKVEMLNKAIEQAINDNKLSPRYTEPEKRRDPRPKKEKDNDGLQRIKFFISHSQNSVREESGFLYETQGLKFGLVKVDYGYRVTELSSGLYVGQISKELPEDWRGFAEAIEYLEKKRVENPQHFIDFELACKSYQERIEKYVGDGIDKPMYKSVQELKDDISKRTEPVYYITERPNGERTVRRFSSFSGGRFNGLNTKGEEILGLTLKGVKFLPNGFMIDGFVFDFRITKNEIEEFENAIMKSKEMKEQTKREREQEEAKEKQQKENEFNSTLDIAEKKIFECQTLSNDEINMLSGTESTIIAELMKRHDIKVPMKTHGWINKQLVRVFFDDGYKHGQNLSGISYSFYKGHDSTTFNGYLKMLEERIKNKMEVAA